MNKLFNKIATGIVGIALAIGVGVAAGSSQCEIKTWAGTGSISSFSDTSGTIVTNKVKYEAFKGDGTTNPTVSSNTLRIYKPNSGKSTGGYIKVTALSGVTLNSVTFTNSSDKAGTVKTKVDGGSLSSSSSLATGKSITVNNINATDVYIYNCGSDRLSFAGISVEYSESTADVTLSVNNKPYTSTSGSSTETVKTTLDGIEYQSYAGYIYNSYLSFNKSQNGAYLGNNTPFDKNIDKIVVDYNSGGTSLCTMYKGSSALAETTTVSPNSTGTGAITYNFGDTDQYFKLKLTKTGSYININSIKIYLGSTPTYTVSFVVNTSGYGTVSQSSITDISKGAAISVSGNTVTIGSTTVTASPHASDAQYTYAFTGWTGTASTVTSNMTITANFSRTTNSYTVTWLNYDGTILETDSNVAYGSTPSYGGSTPTKPSTDEYTYSFTGWNPNPTAVTGNATYTAQFNGTKNTFAVTSAIDNGDLDDKTAIEYGGILAVKVVPSNGYGYPETIGVTMDSVDITSSVIYDNTDGSILYEGVTGIIVVSGQCNPLSKPHDIRITVNNCTYTGPSSMLEEGEAVIAIAPNSGYKLPVAAVVEEVTYVSVSNAVDWSYSSGVITILGVAGEGDVVVTATCPPLDEYQITLNLTNGYKESGPTSVTEGGSATLVIKPDEGYGQPNDVTVSGATKSWDDGTGTLTLSNATGNVSVTYVAVENKLTSITLGTKKTAYILGEDFSMPVVTAHYSVAADKVVTESATKSGYDPYSIGNQSITISYTEGGVTKTSSYSVTVSAKSIVTTVTWDKVASTSDIAVGDVIIIADNSQNVALSTEQRSNNRGVAEITKSNNQITWSEQLTNEPQQLTLTSTSTIQDAPSGSFGLDTGNGFLYTPSSSSNYLRTQATNNINGAFVITVTSGTAVISATGSSNRPLMRSNYNNNPSIFACYAADATTGNGLEIYKKTETKSGTPSLIRIVCDPTIDPATGYKGGEKFVGDKIYTTDFVVKKQLDTGNTLTAITDFTINGGTEVELTSTSNTITVSYTENGISKTTQVVVPATEREAELESIQLVEVGTVKKSGYIDYAAATWNLDNINVHYYWSDDDFDTEVTLASLVSAGEASISPVKPTAGATSFTVSYEYLEVQITNNTIALTEAVKSDYVTGISWTGTSSSQFKAFSGGQLTAEQVATWHVVPTLAGAGVQSELSFSDYTLKVGDKVISSLPYTWQTEDDGKNLSITYGKDINGNDFVKKNGTAVANICASINAIDHDEESSVTVDVYGYKLVSSVPELSTGESIEVVIAANVGGTYYAMDAISSSKGQNYTPTVSNNIISEDDATYTWTLTKTSTGYTLSDSNGKITTTGSNTNISTTESGTDFSITSGVNGTFRIAPSSGTNRPLIYRSGSYDVFGGYSASNVTASGTEYYDLELFTYQVIGSETHTEIVTTHYANQMDHFDTQKIVVEFANYMNTKMNDANVCSGSFANLESAWNDVATKYDELFGSGTTLEQEELEWAKNMLKYATAAWGSEEENACLEKAMKTYEFCVSQHSDICSPFMFEADGTTPLRSVTPVHSFNLLSNNTSAVATVVIISIVSIAAVGGYFFLRKKKED